MSRWNRNIVVPLDSGKENTNRPTMSHSLGTVGKWGKMGFTSTRTYTMSVLPAAVAAAAAAVVSSPQKSPASQYDYDSSSNLNEVVKPRKFFKSRNTAPPEVIAQIIQQLPRQSNSPPRENNCQFLTSTVTELHTPVKEPVRVKLPKCTSSERRKKSVKKVKQKSTEVSGDEEECDESFNEAYSHQKVMPIDAKGIKKKKTNKELKPEGPPSRVLSRTRKTINYCEDDEDDHTARILKESQHPKQRKNDKIMNVQETPPLTPAHRINDDIYGGCNTLESTNVASTIVHLNAISNNPTVASKTPEHPPIVLRISKGTSRLVSTDSDEQQSTPLAQAIDISTDTNLSAEIVEQGQRRGEGVQENDSNLTIGTLQTSPALFTNRHLEDEPAEINFCTVKISPDKPPKERLKLIIKTDVLRNAIAGPSTNIERTTTETERSIINNDGYSTDRTDRSDKEKLRKSKKHKNLKRASIEQQIQPIGDPTPIEFKTPSPHLALGNNSAPQDYQQQLPLPSILTTTPTRSVISPAVLSEKDFDSQSSVLGSISSKGNSTPPQRIPPVEESCVLYSRGSSVVTSDLETSQHSSLVAPPSEIELRLESMMMDVDGSQQQTLNTYLETEPLEEDILAVLRGDETAMETEHVEQKKNGLTQREANSLEMETATPNGISPSVVSCHRTTRGRTKDCDDTLSITDEYSTPATRTRQKKALDSATSSTVQNSNEKTNVQRRTSRRIKKATNSSNSTSVTASTIIENEISMAMDGDIKAPHCTVTTAIDIRGGTSITLTRRRGQQREAKSNNGNHISGSSNNDNSNINKIAANLSAKAGAAELLKSLKDNTMTTTTVTAVTQRTYGRKRKNQQVTQVLQPKSAPEIDKKEYVDDVVSSKVTKLDLQTNNAEKDENSYSMRPFPTVFDVESCLNDNRQNISVLLPMDNDSNSMNSSLGSSQRGDGATGGGFPPRQDYLFKDKFKRTLTLDAAVNNSVATLPTDANINDGVGVGEEPAVKLVISKKKGSIFKSRVPSEQTDQASSKRHLYRHRWDASANGDIVNENESTSSVILANENHAKMMLVANTKSIDTIYSDFNSEEMSNNLIPLTKSNRTTKQNNTTTTAPSVSVSSSSLNSDAIQSTSFSAGGVVQRASEQRPKTSDFYTVVSNVKTAHQIQEIGEYQEMDDDVEYILDALQNHNPLSTRCLSALQLATKCMVPAFRMHVRAHGIVAKFFKALSDANQDLSLGLCTSAIMYILSQEGLNMDLDSESLELMMNLLESERSVAEPADHVNYERNKQKVRELCEEIKAQGRGTHLNVDAITVGTLAMETLLSLTSKRAGEWFKEELRQLGGLEHIIKTINECARSAIESDECVAGIIWTRSLLDNMQTVERCLRVLENVTQMNEENQRYTLMFGDGVAIKTLCSLYILCCREISLNPSMEGSMARDSSNVVIREVLIPLIKVLINLTHPFSPNNTLGAEKIGQVEGTIDSSFYVLLQASNFIPDRCIFEFSILALLLLINLTTYTNANRKRIMCTQVPHIDENDVNQRSSQSQSAISAILAYFYKCEELARLVEKNTDAFLDNQDKTNKKKQEEVDETVNNLLQKAGHHMEHSLKGSYTAILIGHLITDNEQYENIVRKHLRGNGFKEIVTVLEKYYNFMNLTGSLEASVVAHIKSTKKLLDYFKKRDLLYKIDDENKCDMASGGLVGVQYDEICGEMQDNQEDRDINLLESYNNNAATAQRALKTCNTNQRDIN